VLHNRTRPVLNRAADVLADGRSKSERQSKRPGAFFRRLKARLGPAKAITATAHKLARIVYLLLKYGHNYVDPGAQYYEQRYREISSEASKNGPLLSDIHWLKTRHLTCKFLKRSCHTAGGRGVMCGKKLWL